MSVSQNDFKGGDISRGFKSGVQGIIPNMESWRNGSQDEVAWILLRITLETWNTYGLCPKCKWSTNKEGEYLYSKAATK